MWRVIFYLVALPAWADSVVATRAIASNIAITGEDVTIVSMDIEGAARRLEDVFGHTINQPVAAGRAVLVAQVVQSLSIDRNAIVPLVFRTKSLEIHTEGRALSPGKAGDVIDIMNLSSRIRLKGRISPDGVVTVTADHLPE